MKIIFYAFVDVVVLIPGVHSTEMLNAMRW